MQGTDSKAVAHKPIAALAEDKLRELIEKGDLHAIELGLKMRRITPEMYARLTCGI